jgi:apolipoprotein N-acyltransferase
MANELSGNYPYLLWIAPIPIMVLAFRLSAKTTFFISFIAYLLGRLSWFSYLVSVATLMPAVIFTLALSLVFALIMIITRSLVLKYRQWWTIFVFPVLWTSFEFLVIKFSPDGSAGSIAYSQSNFLAFIQIASLTGILGITFIVTLFPSTVAVGFFHFAELKKLKYLSATTALIIAFVFVFGVMRINNTDKVKQIIKVGLAVADERYHYITKNPDAAKEIETAEFYAKEIINLSKQGAQLVVLPERAMNITKETNDPIMQILTITAKENHVAIITGYTNFKDVPERNAALVINNNGEVIVDYYKVHLVTGLEDEFTPGKTIGLFTLANTQAGIAICKDLDFPGYIKQYGINDLSFLCVPAWDFVQDDWLHCRMAILRGVENGFSEIRAARQGRLTISDYYGKVNNEASSATGNAVSLTGEISLEKKETIYSRFGDWFGMINLFATAFFLFLLLKKRKMGALQSI